MRSRHLLAALGLALLLGCGACPPLPSAPPPSSPRRRRVDARPLAAHARFSAFTARFLRSYLERFPTNATALGDHSYDDRWTDTSAEGDAATLRFVDSTRAELSSFAPADLDEEERTDASILANELDRLRFETVERARAETHRASTQTSSATASTRSSRASSRRSTLG